MKITIENLVEYQKQLESNKITQEEYNKKFAEYVEQQKKATAENIALYQSEVRLNEILGDTLAAYDANNRALKEAEALLEQVKSSTKGLTEAEAELIFKQYGTVEAIEAAIEALKAKKKAVDDLGPAYKDALNKSKPFFQDIATKMKVFSKEGNNFVKKMGEFGSLATQPGGLSGLAKGFTEVFNPLNFGVSVITQIVKATKDMIFAVDSAGAAFTRTTGFARNFDGLIASTNERMRQFGVSAEDSSKAIIGLRQGLSQFDTLSASTQEKLTDLVTGLEKIGFAGADAVAVISSLNKAFGISVDVAADMTRELAMSGDALGRTTSQISRDYVKSLSTLAVYGDRSIDVFKNIATMAAAAGVEVDTLVGIANKFDTFSDSAATAAKMNAILGTSFSGVNMMMMDHDKRVKTVIRGLRSTGIAFRNLDKFTQQAIATQLGIQDMDKANRILGMSVGEYTRLQQKQAAAAKSQEAMNEKMNKAMTVLDKLKVIMADFAINLEKTGMIPKIQSLVEGFGSLIQKITPMGLLITGLGSMFVGFAINTAGLVAKIKLVEKFGGSAIEGISNSIAKGLNIVAKASQTSSPALGKLSISLGGIALVIATVAASVALITFSISHMFSTMIQGIVTLKQVGAGFGDVALGIGAMASSVGVLTLAIYGVAKAAAVLSAAGPFGMAIGAILAGTMGAAIGIGTLMAASGDKKKPEVDLSDLSKSAEVISGLTTKLQDLRDNKELLQETFAAIGQGLKQANEMLTADIQSTIANVALITTGQAAGEMTQGAAGAALSRNLGKFIDTVGDYFAGTKDGDGKTMKLQLDGTATADLLNGRIAKAHAITGN